MQTHVVRRRQLRWLFDRQIETLVHRSCPHEVILSLLAQREALLDKTTRRPVQDGIFPFMPVIPKALLDLQAQVQLTVANLDTECSIGPPAEEIKDLLSTPETPYFLLDVEDGAFTRGETARHASTLLEHHDRLSLNHLEIIALGVHTDVLCRHGLLALGSRWEDKEYPKEERVIALYLLEPSTIELGFQDFLQGSILFGAPSCVEHFTS